MKTLIVPCAGKSTRFPDMRPKWLLTHPDGQLMVSKALESFRLDDFSKVVFVIARAHDSEFDAGIILKQAFAEFDSKFELVVLPEFTSGQAETVVQAIRAANVSGPILIKDSDNFISWEDNGDTSNYVVVGNLAKLHSVNNVAAKSFVRLDKNNLILDIVEKRIISNTFCAGAYQFGSADEFISAFHELSNDAGLGKEVYVSHVIAWMMAKHEGIFRGYEASGYEDWGTISEWRTAQKRHPTFFCDVDGVLVKNVGKYGRERWENTLVPIERNLQALKKLYDMGAQIVLVTARGEESNQALLDLMKKYQIAIHAVILNCYHGHRVLINDFAPTNPYPSCGAISVPRDSDLTAYLQQYLT